uniref:Uncharacterized protein n=1 Tax=Sipha flava TaxID=143950 RepID=A0A2S2QFZ2_9HEMI
MTPTVHNVFIHDETVITLAILPIGQLLEVAFEDHNKHYRQFRLHFAQKFSKVDYYRHILQRLLLRPDPYISNCKPRQHKKTEPFSKKAVNLIIASAPPVPPTEGNSEKNMENNEKEDNESEDKEDGNNEDEEYAEYEFD